MTHTPLFLQKAPDCAVCLLPHQQQKHSLGPCRHLGAAAQILHTRLIGLHDDECRVLPPERGACFVKAGYRLNLYIRLCGCKRGQADRLRCRAAHQKDRILSRLFHVLSPLSITLYFMQRPCFCQSISLAERRDKENRYRFFPNRA